MEDRFKFRAYIKPEMVYDGYNGCRQNGALDVKFVFSDDNLESGVYVQRWSTSEEKNIDYYDFDDVTLMQCTGLKDAKGELIYEGDILAMDFPEIGTQKAIVAWNKKYGQLTAVPINDWQFCLIDECVIIGNVYENSDLINNLSGQTTIPRP